VRALSGGYGREGAFGLELAAGRAMLAGAKAAPVFTGYTAPWAGSLPWPVYRRPIQGSAGGNGFWGMAAA